jgi:hypothetical protein
LEDKNMMENGIDRENLQKLATYLAYGELPEDVRFDMEFFTDGNQLAPVCGAAGCAVGFAPFAGIEKGWEETFSEYCDRTLIDFQARDGGPWDWCFGNWKDVDNTPFGAAKRIQKLLNDGKVPTDWPFNVTAIALYKKVEVLR